MRLAGFALVVLAGSAITGSAFAETAAVAEGPIACSGPIAQTDSLKSLKARYKDAVIEEVPGAEAETYKALVLFPKAPDQRLVVAFDDEAMTRVSSITLDFKGKPSRWTIAGLGTGASVADVQKANGKPFQVAGFGWDYGGFVVEWNGGTLGKTFAGGCTLTMRFGKGDAGAPDALSGDGVKVKSDDARLLKWAPKVEQITLSFPTKDGD